MSIETFSNNAASTLSGSIGSTDTTLSVASASQFPATGNFRIVVDSELMLVTAVSGSTFSITRGVEGTVAASHAPGAAVTHILTAGALAAFRSNSVSSGAYAALPSAGLAGRLYFPQGGGPALLDTGSGWQALGAPGLNPPPLAAAWTWSSQPSGATLADSAAGPCIANTGFTVEDTAVVLKSLPSAPYTVTMGFRYISSGPTFGTSAFFGGGMCLKLSSGNKLKLWQVRSQSDSSPGMLFNLRKMTDHANNAGSETSYRGFVPTGLIWLRIADDNTTRYYQASADGVNFITLASEARATDFTPDQIGFHLWGATTAEPSAITLCSYTETQP